MTISADPFSRSLFSLVILSSISACDGDTSADLLGDESGVPAVIDNEADRLDKGRYSTAANDSDLDSSDSSIDTQSEYTDSLNADRKQSESDGTRRVKLDDLSEEDIDRLLNMLADRINNKNRPAESPRIKEGKQEGISNKRIAVQQNVNQRDVHEDHNNESEDRTKSDSSDYIKKLAEVLTGKGPEGNLYHPSPFGKDNEGSIGSLTFFDVLAIHSDDTIQIVFFDRDIAFISNVDATDFVTGDRYFLRETVLAMGNMTYTTVLGATHSAPLYRAYSDTEYKQAQKIASEVKAKKQQAEEEAQALANVAAAKRREYRKLVNLIDGMKQNAERIEDFDRDIMKQVAEAVDNQIYELREDSDMWPKEWSVILDELKQCNAMYLVSGDNSNPLLNNLAGIMERAKKLKPELP